MRMKLIMVFCLAVTVFIFTGNVVEAQVPEIIHAIPRDSSGYGGGVTCYPLTEDFKIYETNNSAGSGAQYIDIKSPVNGAVEGSIQGVYIGHKDITYDSKRNHFWATTKGGPIVGIPVTGGGYAILVDLVYEYGIFYDSELDCLWVGGGSIPQIWKVSPESGAVLETINIDHGLGRNYSAPAGVVKTNETFWVGVAGDYGGSTDDKAWVVELDRQGTFTGRRLQLPELDGAHDIGGFTLDPNGYLWVKGGKGTSIYQIDIGYVPASDDLPVIDSGDYDGDSTSDIAIFRAGSGLWAVRDVTRAYFGTTGDIPASGDFDGDGTTDLVIFRPSSGLWAAKGVTRAYFGGSSDTAVPGDYDADGSCEAAIYRPSSGLWAVRGVTRAYFGGSSDSPVPVYGSGRTMAKDIGIFRPSSGLWAIRGLTRAYFGTLSDKPVTGYDAAAIYRPSSGLWAIRGMTRAYFGVSSDQPVPGNYTGFVPADIGIFRDSSGLWAIRDVTRVYFGTDGDISVSGLAINPSSAAGF